MLKSKIVNFKRTTYVYEIQVREREDETNIQMKRDNSIILAVVCINEKERDSRRSMN